MGGTVVYAYDGKLIGFGDELSTKTIKGAANIAANIGKNKNEVSGTLEETSFYIDGEPAPFVREAEVPETAVFEDYSFGEVEP